MARGDPLDIVYIECVSWPLSIFVAVIAMLILYHLHAFSIASRTGRIVATSDLAAKKSKRTQEIVNQGQVR
jgi:hypothetical protein